MNETPSGDSSLRQEGPFDITRHMSSQPHSPVPLPSTDALSGDLQLLRSAFTALTDGVAVTDADGRFVVFNDSARRILGIGETDVSPEKWPEVYGLHLPGGVTLYPARDLPLARAMQGEVVVEAPILVRNERLPAGLTIVVSATPLRDKTGRVIGAVAVFHDVSVRKETMDSLQRLRSAVEQTADTVIISDREGTIEYVNDAFVATTGYRREEALGRTPRILSSGVHDKAFYERLWKTIQGGEPFRGIVVNRKKNGELYQAEQTISPILDAAGNITHFVSVAKDITDRLLLAEQQLELRVARSVQTALYPAAAPRMKGVDIAGAAYPAEEMCGDYFDYLPMHGGCLGVVVGDVSGHGLGPALLMAETRAYLRSYARTQVNVGEVLTWVNRTLADDMPEEHFVAMLLLCLDPVGRTLTYSNAGHPPGFVLSQSGAVRMELPSSGPPLGLFSETVFAPSFSITLESGDIVLLATDGFEETAALGDRQFGPEGVVASLKARRDRSAAEILAGLYEDARAFASGQRQTDDMAAVVIKFDS